MLRRVRVAGTFCLRCCCSCFLGIHTWNTTTACLPTFPSVSPTSHQTYFSHYIGIRVLFGLDHKLQQTKKVTLPSYSYFKANVNRYWREGSRTSLGSIEISITLVTALVVFRPVSMLGQRKLMALPLCLGPYLVHILICWSPFIPCSMLF